MTSNFAYSTVATAPSPASSGTSLVVASGEGSRFYVGKAFIAPAGSTPTPANSEVVSITAISTDTLTITRAVESSSARTVGTGDLVYQGVSAGMWDGLRFGGVVFDSGKWTFPVAPSATGNGILNWGRLVVTPFVWSPVGGETVTVDAVAVRCSTAGDASSVHRLGLYTFSGGEPSVLFSDLGTVDVSSTGTKTITGLGLSLPPGRYGFACALQRATSPTTQAQLTAASASDYRMHTSDDSNRDQLLTGTFRVAYYKDGSYTSGGLPSAPTTFLRANSLGVTFALKVT